MANDPQLKASFSPWRRWGIGLDFAVRTVLVLAVIMMVNYLGARWFYRCYLSSETRVQLSDRTTGLLWSLTNQVTVTVYYDKDNPLFPAITGLLNEYRDANPRLHVTVVDYLRDAGAAEKLKRDHKNYFVGVTNKNLVIFDCDGRVKSVNGNALGEYALELVPGETKETRPEYVRKLVAFRGEMVFTSVLLAVTNPKPLKAYYLTGHGEHPLDGGDETGYLTFASILQQNYIQVQPLGLLGTNPVPMDCNLLIIAGPATPFAESELEKIDDYLHQGGRLFLLFNYASLQRPTGLEKIVAGWGVDVGRSVVEDRNNSLKGSDVVVMDFGQRPHPIVNPLTGSALHLLLPRAVGRLDVGNPPADAPHVEEIAFTSAGATADKHGPRMFPLAVAVEKGAVRGVITERGSTRLVVVGDSIFLGNHQIESAANRDFAGYAVNWLLDQTQLMQGLGPRPIKEFRLTMTRSQFQTVQWILLAVMPGAVLLLGGLVWLRRRS